MLYVPGAFAATDPNELYAHAARYPFATLVTSRPSPASPASASSVPSASPGELAISHLPLLVDPSRGTLRGHLARENPQHEHLAAGAEAVAIFHGPHGYVSPSVYKAEGPNVPTWNYVVVHAHGRARVVDEGVLRVILNELVERFDSTGWRFDPGPQSAGGAFAAIAGFEIRVERLEGKFKLSQNRSAEDRQAVADWFAAPGDEAGSALAALMRSRS